MFCASRSTVTPPGTIRSIINRWPNAASAARSIAFTQHRAMRQNDGERRIVADRAEIAEVIGDPFHLRHQRAQPDGARRRREIQRRLHRAGEAEAQRHRAVAGHPAGEPRRLLQRQTAEQFIDAFVDVAEPLLQPNDCLTVAGETKMPRLDDAGVNRTDRDLMQALTLHRQERVIRSVAMIQPGRAGPATQPARSQTNRGSRVRAESPADAPARPRGSARPDRAASARRSA